MRNGSGLTLGSGLGTLGLPRCVQFPRQVVYISVAIARRFRLMTFVPQDLEASEY